METKYKWNRKRPKKTNTRKKELVRYDNSSHPQKQFSPSRAAAGTQQPSLACTLTTPHARVLFPKPIPLSNAVWLEKAKDNDDEEKIVQWYKGLLMAYQPFHFLRPQLTATQAQKWRWWQNHSPQHAGGCTGCTWKEQISWAWFLGDAILRIRTCFGFPAEWGTHELQFLGIKLIWRPSQTAWMSLFPLLAFPLGNARYLGQTFSEGKTKVFVTTFLGWIAVIEVHLQQQDFSQLCTV